MGNPVSLNPIILVVDDELRMCESLEWLLKTKDYEVYTATCGQDGLALFGKTAFDLAVLDVHLPDMLGTELLEQVKARNPHIPVIVMTGDANLESALAALRCGAYDYLRKPFEFEEFLKTVENALNQGRLKWEKETISHELLRSEEKYRYLVQNSPDIIYTLDADGNFTFINDALEHLLGFSVEELIGKHVSTIVCEDDRDKAIGYFDGKRSRERDASGIELRLQAVVGEQQKDSLRRYLTVEVKSMGIFEESPIDGQRRHVGTHGVIRDISERQRLHAQIQKDERLKSLGTLAGGIAHDFNNLLMGIQGRSSLIAMDLEDSHPAFEHLHAIDECIYSASHLTKQLLGFARGGKYEVKPVNLNELIVNSARIFGRTKKEVTIETQFHDTTIVVDADPRQIDQVLLNLYVNAWQAMPEGGTLRLETRKVTLDTKDAAHHQVEPGRYARLSVTDTGVGMDQKTLQRIYDPFFSTKDKSQGAGLGLASAYGIIKNHAGIIHAQSELGHGTTFTIYLPISEKTVVNEDLSAQTVSNGFGTILLVDDEHMIVEVNQALLKRLGYQVIAAKCGEEAVEVVHRLGQGVDLVILDMIMPGMDGGKTFDCIREISPEMPILLSSGYAINGRAQQIMNRGCNGFIQKPFSLGELSQKVGQLLDDQRVPV